MASSWLIPSGTVAKRMQRRITASARMLQKKIFLFLLFQRPVEESCVIVFIIVRYLSMFSFRSPASFFPPHMACHYHIIPQNAAFVPILPDTDSAFSGKSVKPFSCPPADYDTFSGYFLHPQSVSATLPVLQRNH